MAAITAGSSVCFNNRGNSVTRNSQGTFCKQMTILFYVLAASMVLVALSFVVRPFVPAISPLTRGFAQLPLLIAVLTVLGAVAIYFVIGRPDATVISADSHARGTEARRGDAATGGQKQLGSVGSMVDGLAEKLKQHPDDGDSWLLLARSYDHLGRHEEARAAYAKAEALGKSDPSLESALDAVQPEDSAAIEIRGRVTLAASAAAEVSDSDTVYVIAKAFGGPPMPLAVVRKPASELPFEFVLNDESSMVRGMELSTAGKIVVTAKISKTGDALQSMPGYEVQSNPFDAGDSSYLDLEIDPTAGTTSN